MYTPQRFKSSDTAEAFEHMDCYPFAALVSVVDGKPVVTHLPLTPKRTGDQVELIGHFAKANPHWKSLAGAEVTAIFQGPHTYITPVWYAEDNVPTWNYSTVHAIGKIELLETYDEIIGCLKELTTHVERHWPSGWEFYIPEEIAGPILPKSIVGFKIKVGEILYKKKLSQNRTSEDRAGVLKGLEARKDENSQLVLKDMQKLYSSDGFEL